jgi:hypothetical protein
MAPGEQVKMDLKTMSEFHSQKYQQTALYEGQDVFRILSVKTVACLLPI